MKNYYLIVAIGLFVILIIGGFIGLKMVKNLKTSLSEKYENAYFAGGCFWCMESDFEKIPGVIDVVSGYSGGDEENPSYEEVSSGSTGHRESVKIIYNPEIVSYEKLLEKFWINVDPFDSKGQFCDRGFQYTSAIFYQNSEEKKLAEQSKKKVEQLFDRNVSTEIVKFKNFYTAEEKHQQYYEKHPVIYKFYRYTCGRDKRLGNVWENKTLSLNQDKPNLTSKYEDFEKPSDAELKEQLTEIQYKVTQKEGTEKPFDNEYNENKHEGIYVDILSGEPLFSSTDKYDSGTGWPSFTKPLDSQFIVEKADYKLFIKRIEVRSKYGDSHLGHVFNDGPEPTGKRYCMNSAALRFIPKEKMKELGYGDYLYLFE